MKCSLPLAALLIVALLAACTPRPPVYQEQLLTFGTLVDVTLWDVDEARGRQAVATLGRDFEYMHNAWHAWHRGPLGRVNQLLPTGEFFSCPPSIVPLIRRSSELSEASGGLFNPAIGQLVKLWGFASDEAPEGPPPASEAIRALLEKNPQMSDLELDGIQLRSRNPAVRLDFGAFAKGYAIDRAIEQLRELGIANAIVNAGGDLRAIGRHGKRPWRIGIRHPRQPGMLASVDIEGDESVFTSGDYERYFDYDGKRYQHIIDPRSGYPAEGLSSVTVFAPRADMADAAATAITVAGPKPADWLPVARALGVSGVMLVDTEGRVQMTPSLRERIYFDIEPKPDVRFSEPL